MVIAIYIAAVIIGLALLGVASTLGDAISSAISDGMDTIRDAIEEAAPKDHNPRPTRKVLPEAGTRLAYVRGSADGGLQVCYTPVLALVEWYNADYWLPLVILDGTPEVYQDSDVSRVLLPGESLSEEQCDEIKERYLAQSKENIGSDNASIVANQEP